MDVQGPLLLLLAGLALVSSECPSTDGLPRWSSYDWPTGAPVSGGSVVIDTDLVLDVSPPDLHNITIQNGASLIWEQDAEIHVRVDYIWVAGALVIGNEGDDCLFQGETSITLTGLRGDYELEEGEKGIIVTTGGALEIHGQRKRSWTKLTRTVNKLENSGDLRYAHEEEARAEEDKGKAALVAYTFTLAEDSSVTVKDFGVYDFFTRPETDTPRILNHINNVEDGEYFLMATQKYFRVHNGKADPSLLYDAFETLVHGSVTGDTELRNLAGSLGQTYAMVYQKGNAESFKEISNPVGTDSIAWLVSGDIGFVAMAYGDETAWMQEDDFVVRTLNGFYPRIDVIDDVTTWKEGDTVVFTSTDYDWLQAEEKTVVACSDCSNYQFRIDSPTEFMHYGEIVEGAVDMRGEVALLTRNVVIQGEVQDTCPPVNENCGDDHIGDVDTYGGHMKIYQGYANVRIEGVELRSMGQQTDNGRYPIHFHLCEDKVESAATPYIRETAIHHTLARCITVHGTHGVEIVDNVCYHSKGHSYFLEDGGEKYNTFDGNIAISTMFAPGEFEPTDSQRPTSFWITNPLTRFVNNVAAGGPGTGIWFIYPDKPLGLSADMGLMDEFEARRTSLLGFDNNVGHSNLFNGIMFGWRIQEDRTLTGNNHYQPLIDPKDENSEEIDQVIEHITAYKNRANNVYIEGGRIRVSHVSVADSISGVTVSNSGILDNIASIEESVVIGDSANFGEPTSRSGVNYPRALPKPWEPDVPRTGFFYWRGPNEAKNLWFKGFQTNEHYDMGAISFKIQSPYPMSPWNTVKDMKFAFDDGPATGNRMLHGVKDVNPGFADLDGDLTPQMKDLDGTVTGSTLQVVKPDPFTAAGDCLLRTNWNMAVCNNKYGALRVATNGIQTDVVGVRDDFPGAQLELELRTKQGFPVVLDDDVTYTVHFLGNVTSRIILSGEGVERGYSFRAGICLPPNAEFELRTNYPYMLKGKDKFIEAASLKELDKESADDGKKFYYHAKSGMLYFKFVSLVDRAEGELYNCPGNQCPFYTIDLLSGDVTDGDCRKRLYKKKKLKKMPKALNTMDTSLPATDETVPEGWGAGSTRPMSGRTVVDGGFNDWSEWSECSVNCGGSRTRSRSCNNPMPQNGGQDCEALGAHKETESCSIGSCPVHGGFSDWGEWSATCTLVSGCEGYRVRSRDCDNPVPQLGGRACTGYPQEWGRCTQNC